MRPLIALLVAVAILGGVQWFLQRAANQVATLAPVEERKIKDEFEVEVLLTFEAGPDPFAGADGGLALQVAMRGEPIIERTETVSAGQSIRVMAPSIVEGKNEFVVTAVGLDENPDLERALRIRVFRNGQSIGEKWLASDPGEPVTGTITIDASMPQAGDEHDH